MQLICIETQQNLHGRTAEFVWMHNLICIDTQQKLHGQTGKFAWTHKFEHLGQKKIIHVLFLLLPFVLLRPKFYGYRSQSAAAS